MPDFDDLPLIDQHVHVFDKDSDKPEFDPLTTFTLGGDWIQFLESGGHVPTDQERHQLRVNQQQTMTYHEAMHAIARYLGCEPSREAIIAARATRDGDYETYVRGMYRAITLETNIGDLRYPNVVNLDDFGALTGVPASGLVGRGPLTGG